MLHGNQHKVMQSSNKIVQDFDNVVTVFLQFQFLGSNNTGTPL